MAITFVSEATWITALGAGTEVETLPGSLQENDIVLICLCADNLNEGAGNDGIIGQGYTNINGPTGTTPGRQICYKRMGATPDTTVTVTQEADKAITGIAQAWRGVDTTTAVDATATSASGLSANPNSPAIVTVTDGALVLSIALLDDDDSCPITTYPSGYTNTLCNDAAVNDGANGATVGIASTIKATAGSEDPGAYTITSDAWFAFTVALRPAVGGGAQEKNRWIIGCMGGATGTNRAPGIIQ